MTAPISNRNDTMPKIEMHGAGAVDIFDLPTLPERSEFDKILA